MEFKTDALLLRTADIGENDKIVTLFTAERGKLSAVLKGVKKAGAKLRFAAQPFCFAEYVFASRGGRNTVISASLHEGFYPLRENLALLYAGAAVTGACDALLFEGMSDPALLLSAVEALRALADGGEEGADFALVSFLLSALKGAGYPVRAGACPVCGNIPSGRVKFDMESGMFTCADCSDGVIASESTFLSIGSLLKGGKGASADGLRRALRLLRAYFYRKTETDISALSEYFSLRE